MKLLLWLLGTEGGQSDRCVHDLGHQEYKKFVRLIVFVKDISDIYLNNIYNIAFSLHLVR